MAVKIEDFLKSLALASGVKSDNPKLNALLSATGEVDDEIAGAIQNNPNLISLDAAKSHPDLQTHFYGKALAGVDALIHKSAEDLGLTTQDLADIKAEKSTHLKLNLMKERAKTNFEGKLKTPVEKQALIDEIAKLNSEIANTKNLTKAEIEAAKKEADSMVTDSILDSFFSSQKYANKDLAPETSTLVAKSTFDKWLKDNNAILVRDGKEFKIKNAANPDLDFLNNNKPVNFRDSATKVLADSKLLEVTAPAPKGPAKFQPNPADKGNGPDMSKVMSAYDKQLASLETAQ